MHNEKKLRLLIILIVIALCSHVFIFQISRWKSAVYRNRVDFLDRVLEVCDNCGLHDVDNETQWMFTNKPFGDRRHDSKDGLSTAPIDLAVSTETLKLLSEDPDVEHVWVYGKQPEVFRQCRARNWYGLGELPKASVIITFIDHENLAILLRTVHSVLKYTSRKLLAEIILVEDNCKKAEFHSILDVYLTTVFESRIRVIRNNVTLGLIKARQQGIRAAIGEVVVVMDSHVEVQPNWLEPLLFEIKFNRATLASSFLDWLEYKEDKWVYSHGGSDWKTYFDMYLIFGFQQISTLTARKLPNKIAPIETPVIVGTIWAMNKAYFKEIGEVDEDMQLWGGENLELPIRVWLMGGRVVNVPCSHVAHLEIEGYRNYRRKWQATIDRNYKRMLVVWMEDYLEYFYFFNPNLRNIDPGDVSSRKSLRKKAKHSFSWYLDNIYPELGIPQVHGWAYGVVHNVGTQHCLIDVRRKLYTYSCQDIPRMIYFLNHDNEFRDSTMVYVVSEQFTAVVANPGISTYKINATVKWVHNKNGHMQVQGTNLCMESQRNDVVKVTKCSANPKQHWRFQYYKEDTSSKTTTSNFNRIFQDAT